MSTMTFIPRHIAPDAPLPARSLHRVSFAPVSTNAWKAGDTKLNEPSMQTDGVTRYASGVVVIEPDNRVWLAEPTGHWDGLTATHPGGKVEKGLTPQQNARKETLEEMGLLVQLTGWLGDVLLGTGYGMTLRRYYVGWRVGGDPREACRETQAVHLCAMRDAWSRLNTTSDRNLLLWLKRGLRGQFCYVPHGMNLIAPPAPIVTPEVAPAEATQKRLAI